MQILNKQRTYKNYTEISRKFLLEMYSVNETDNVVCSPFSFYILLCIALNATSGKSREEIKDAIAKGVSVANYTDTIKSLQRDFTERTEGAKLNCSNAICIKKELFDSILDDFKALVQDGFNGEIFSGDADMVGKVNAWVNKKTDGIIPRIMDLPPANLRIMLMNAVAFEAEWEHGYEEDDICEEYKFTNADGTISKVTMLDSREKDYIEDNFYTGFVKYYKGGRYAFLALLPKETENKIFFKRALEQADFRNYYDLRQKCKTYVKMPEFEIKTSAGLTSFCNSLGIKRIFTEEADFRNITTKEPLMVDSVLQKAFIKVDRRGTKAFAVTAMCVALGCVYTRDSAKYVTLDRPFVYAIINRDNGLPVFSGVVNRMRMPQQMI
ncbi:MAG: serpin family protein [Lachnospiraceae bacterium]|nr:serpin family protein [Lachnospiraceae bacterium]